MFPYDQYLAIDYGSTYLKGVLFKEAFGKTTILRTEILPIVSIQESNEDPFEYNIVRFIQSFFPEEQKFLINLNPHQVFLREVSLPITSEKAMQDILPFEMENLVPVPMEELEVKGKPWRINKDSSDVLCFNAHHGELSRVMGPFSKGDMHLSCLSVDSFTLPSILAEHLQNTCVLQLDIGGQYSLLNVLLNGKLRLTRVVPIGGEQITSRIASLLKIDRSKAEEIKKGIDWEAFSENKDPGPKTHLDFVVKKESVVSIQKAILEEFEELVSEIENTILILSEGEKPTQIFVSGGGSNFRDSKTYLAKELNLILSNYSNEVSSDFITAFSMGVHSNSRNRLDFLDSAYVRGLRKSSFQWKSFRPHLILTSVSLVILLAVFAIGVILDNRKIQANKKILADKYKQGFGVEIKEDENAVSLASNKLKAEKKKTEIFRLFLSQASILDLIHELSDLFPSSDSLPFVLDQFNFEGNEIQIYGRVNEFSEIGLIQSALEKSEKFTNVQVLNKRLITGVNKLKVSFKFKLDIVIPKDEI